MKPELIKKMGDDCLAEFAKSEQGRADYLQSLAARAQRGADRARKEIRRREREARA